MSGDFIISGDRFLIGGKVSQRIRNNQIGLDQLLIQLGILINNLIGSIIQVWFLDLGI